MNHPCITIVFTTRQPTPPPTPPTNVPSSELDSESSVEESNQNQRARPPALEDILDEFGPITDMYFEPFQSEDSPAPPTFRLIYDIICPIDMQAGREYPQ